MPINNRLYANNAKAVLTTNIGPTDTTLPVSTIQGFPVPSATESFLVTLESGADIEIVEVRRVSGTTFVDCVRGREGTTAKSFTANARVENRLTAGTLSKMITSDSHLVKVSHLHLLIDPENSQSETYIVQSGDDTAAPVIVIRNDTSWRFHNYPRRVVSKTADTAGTPTSASLTAAQPIIQAFAVRTHIVQFVTGANKGQCRYISAVGENHVEWQEPLPHAVASGDRFEIYQSITSYLLQAASTVSGENVVRHVQEADPHTQYATKTYVDAAIGSIPSEKYLQGLHSYDSVNNVLKLQLNDGSTVDISVGDLITDALNTHSSHNDPHTQYVTSAELQEAIASMTLNNGVFGALPTGAVIPFAYSGEPPPGYLQCNGATLSRDSYPELFAKIGTTYGAPSASTFQIPDLRGEFIRGWDEGRGVDSGRALGSSQGEAFKSHSHSASSSVNGDHTHSVNKYWGGAAGSGGNITSNETHAAGTQPTNSAGSHSHSITVDAAGGVETRPRNVALRFCIKYTHAYDNELINAAVATHNSREDAHFNQFSKLGQINRIETSGTFAATPGGSYYAYPGAYSSAVGPEIWGESDYWDNSSTFGGTAAALSTETQSFLTAIGRTGNSARYGAPFKRLIYDFSGTASIVTVGPALDKFSAGGKQMHYVGHLVTSQMINRKHYVKTWIKVGVNGSFGSMTSTDTANDGVFVEGTTKKWRASSGTWVTDPVVYPADGWCMVYGEVEPEIGSSSKMFTSRIGATAKGMFQIALSVFAPGSDEALVTHPVIDSGNFISRYISQITTPRNSGGLTFADPNDATVATSTNGYYVLPSGLIIQWGRIESLGTDGINGTIGTFPIRFPKVCLQVQGTDFHAGCHGIGMSALMPGDSNGGPTQFKVWGLKHDGTFVNTGVNWLAIGY